MRWWLDNFDEAKDRYRKRLDRSLVYKRMLALLYGILVTALDHLKAIEEEKGMFSRSWPSERRAYAVHKIENWAPQPDCQPQKG